MRQPKTDSELTEEIQKAERAKQLIKDPMITKAIMEMRDICYHNIRTSHHSKKDEREDLYYMLRAIDRFEEYFKSLIVTGKKATEKLKIRSQGIEHEQMKG